MATQLSTEARDAMMDALRGVIDGGAGAIIETRTGSPPANCAAADSGTLLATNAMSATAYAASSSGTIQENAIADDASADASGTPGHYRVKKESGGVCVAQGTAGVGSGDLNFDASITSGGNVSISDMAYTAPGA